MEEIIIPIKQNNNDCFRCTDCKQLFDSQVKLNYHIWKFNSSETSTLHVQKVPTNSQERNFRCTYCEKSFKFQGYLSNHIKKCHSIKMEQTKKNLIFKCFRCHKVLKSRQRLKLHKVVHSNKRPFKCDICQKAFKIRNNLYQHKKIHRNKREFKCDTCGYSFNFKCHLIRHLQTHVRNRSK